jgi:hypothetical protein
VHFHCCSPTGPARHAVAFSAFAGSSPLDSRWTVAARPRWPSASPFLTALPPPVLALDPTPRPPWHKSPVQLRRNPTPSVVQCCQTKIYRIYQMFNACNCKSVAVLDLSKQAFEDESGMSAPLDYEYRSFVEPRWLHLIHSNSYSRRLAGNPHFFLELTTLLVTLIRTCFCSLYISTFQ